MTKYLCWNFYQLLPYCLNSKRSREYKVTLWFGTTVRPIYIGTPSRVHTLYLLHTHTPYHTHSLSDTHTITRILPHTLYHTHRCIHNSLRRMLAAAAAAAARTTARPVVVASTTALIAERLTRTGATHDCRSSNTVSSCVRDSADKHDA